MTRGFRYLLLDVFTANPFTGNQLAVFLDGNGLSDAEMQALARETNLSETTFCFPGQGAPEEGVKVRIFTVSEELPFAGHPTLGTAAALRWVVPGLRGASVVSLRLGAGLVPVRFEAETCVGEGIPFGRAVWGEMEQPLPRFGQEHDPDAVAAALGLAPDAVARDRPVQTVSTGLPFCIVRLTSQAALSGLRTTPDATETYLRTTDAKFFYVLADGKERSHWRARMQFYGGEDPATGSAAGSATAWLVRHRLAVAGERLSIEQGVEMDRPSLLETRAVLEPAAAGDRSWAPGSYVRVGGRTVPVAEGRFFLP